MNDTAATQVYAFLIAGVVFISSIGFILFLSNDARPGRVEQELSDTDASSLAEILFSSPGVGWGDPDDVVRLGLLESGRNLSIAKLAALNGASFTSASNDKVDYDDARTGLGLSNYDFHIRIYPNALQLNLQYADLSATRAAYIGDWTSLASVTVPFGTDPQMEADAQSDLDAQAILGTLEERILVDGIGFDFDNQVFITTGYPTVLVDLNPLPDLPLLDVLGVTLIEGDVYPDNKQYLDNVLAPRLVDYHVLFVGSGVDQNTLTSAVTKNAVRDFVLAGGTLVVLGTDEGNVQWMKPLFDAGIATANTGSLAPDPAHPLLTQPHSLSYTAYDDMDFAWDLTQGGGEETFQYVVTADDDAVLAVSMAGAYGAGRIFVTSYWPSEIKANIGATEALGFLTNLAVYSERENLYLDYGLPIPEQATGLAVREMTIYDEQLGLVPVIVEVFVW